MNILFYIKSGEVYYFVFRIFSETELYWDLVFYNGTGKSAVFRQQNENLESLIKI